MTQSLSVFSSLVLLSLDYEYGGICCKIVDYSTIYGLVLDIGWQIPLLVGQIVEDP